MRRVTTKPLLLLSTLALTIAAIIFIETRFDAASPDTGVATSQPVARTAAPEPPETAETTRNEERTGMEEAGEENTDEAEDRDPSSERIAGKEAEYERAHEIVAPTGFVNTDGVTIGENLGEKVILLDFWTYSCYNCQNTQPYLNAWQEEYADDGLLIIGVHKPEFEFEKDYNGVAEAVELAGITYPVVLDNNDATWDAYDQRFWPTMYLVDSDGFVRYKHIGEGAYDETEAKIQELLAERDRINSGS
ncbi:MAG: redoxin domain-containing protein [Rubrobacteraceae bacterium]